MKILDVLTAPWAIEPPKLIEIQAIYATHLRGERIDIAGVEARLGRPLVNEPKEYEVVDGVAVVSLDGVLAKRMNLFMEISGGTSMQIAGRTIRHALADDEVHSIVLLVDSPGGTVDGTQGLADIVMQARGIKPIVTLADGAMASAAYWIGSAAQQAYIADGTTLVGSIGVVTRHMDVSKSEEMRGVKTTELYSGKYKRIASEYAPLSEEGRQSIQEKLDYTYSLFVAAVAKNRGTSEEKVLQDMADGRVFIGEQAIAAGLVDGVSTLEALIARLNTNRAGAARPAPSATSQGVPMSLTRAELEAQAPDLVKALIAEGAAAELARVQGVHAQSTPGHEKLVATMMFDGKSTAGDAAMAVLAAESKSRQAHASASAADAPPAVPQVPAATVQPPAGAGAEASADPEVRAKAAWDKDAKLRAEFADSFPTYLAYAKAQAAGQVKVLKSSKE